MFRCQKNYQNIIVLYKICAEKPCYMVEEVVWEQWMFQPNACIEVENDKANNQFDRVILNYRWR